MSVTIRNRYTPDPEGRSDFTPSGKSMTKQSEAYDADINVIVGKYLETRDPSILGAREGFYGDVSGVGDYLSCLATVKQAEEAFADLPAKVRDHFKNDPAELIACAFDEGRREELRSLGLLEPGASPATPEAPDAPPA